MKMMNSRVQALAAPQVDKAAAAEPALPVAPMMQQAAALGTLVSQSAARNLGNGAATAAMLPLATRVDTWTDMLAMQSAVAARYQQLQQGWLKGWNTWSREQSQLKRANTMSELVEQQFNLMAQFGAMFKNQAADLLALQENIEVDYGYWVAQKVRSVSDPG